MRKLYQGMIASWMVLPIALTAAEPAVPAGRMHTLIRLMGSIARHEGWGRPNSLVRRLHNPGALVYAGQPKSTASVQGFAAFPDDAAGWAALRRDLDAKSRLRLTVRETMQYWCGGCYLDALVRETGLTPDSVW